VEEEEKMKQKIIFDYQEIKADIEEQYLNSIRKWLMNAHISALVTTALLIWLTGMGVRPFQNLGVLIIIISYFFVMVILIILYLLSLMYIKNFKIKGKVIKK